MAVFKAVVEWDYSRALASSRAAMKDLESQLKRFESEVQARGSAAGGRKALSQLAGSRSAQLKGSISDPAELRTALAEMRRQIEEAGRRLVRGFRGLDPSVVRDAEAAMRLQMKALRESASATTEATKTERARGRQRARDIRDAAVQGALGRSAGQPANRGLAEILGRSRIPSEAEVRAAERVADQWRRGGGASTIGLLSREALADRFFGLRVGRGVERGFREDDLGGDAARAREAEVRAAVGRALGRIGVAPESNLGVRTQLTQIRREREVRERRAGEEVRIEDAGLRRATAALAATLRRRQIIEEAAALEARRGLADQEGSLRLARQVYRARVGLGARPSPDEQRLLALGGAAAATDRNAVRAQTAGLLVGNPRAVKAAEDAVVANRHLANVVSAGADDQQRTNRDQQAAAVRARVSRQQLNAATAAAAAAEQAGSKSRVQILAERAVNERRLNRAVNQAAQALTPRQGSPTQQIQAYIARRQGGPARSPLDFLTGPQLLTSRFLTTAGFALSGGITYGLVQGIRDALKAATELQYEMSLIDGMLRQVGDTGNESFGRIRAQILKVSHDTAVAANEVAFVTRQLAGAFADPQTGTPDFVRGLQEAQTALRLSRVTGLPLQEITDSLTSVSLSFRQTFTEVADVIVGLEPRFGVLSTEIVRFAADLAPVAKELGFSLTELASLGAIAQQRSGQSGGSLAEQFRRILPSIHDNESQLLSIIADNAKTADLVGSTAEAFASGDVAEVLKNLIRAYHDLNGGQKEQLASLVGSRREAGAFYAVLEAGDATLRALNARQDEFAGSFEKRWQRFTQTVQYSFDQLRRGVQEIGVEIIDSGIGDALVEIAQAGTGLARIVAQMLRVFGQFNDVLGGLPGKVIALALAWRLLGAAMRLGGRLAGPAGQALTGGGVSSLAARFAPIPAGTAARTFAGPVPGRLGAGYGPLVYTRTPGVTGLIARSSLLARIGPSVGPAVAGIAAGLGPMALAIGAAFALATVTGVSDRLRQESASLREKVAKAITEGKSEAQVRAEIRTSGRNLGEQLVAGITGQKSESAVITDEFQKARAEGTIAKLRQIDKLPGGDSLKELVQALQDDPESDFLQELASKIIRAGQDRSGQLEAAFAEIDRKQSERDATAVDLTSNQKRSEANLRTLTEARTLFAAGRSPLTDLLPVIDAQIRLVKQRIAIHKRHGDDDIKAIEELAALENERRQAIDQTVSGERDFRNRLAQLTGRTDRGAARVGNAQAALAQLRRLGVTDSKLLTDAAIELVEAQREAFNEYVNAASSDAARAARAAEGFTIDPAARRILITAATRTTQAEEVFRRVAEAVGSNIGRVRTATVNAIFTFAQGEADINLKMLQARRAELEAIQRSGSFFAQATVAGELRRVQDAITQYTDLRGGLDVPTTGIVDVDNTKVDPAEEARKLAQARSRLEKARAGGDPVGTAVADLALANRLLELADRSDEAAVLEAQAQVIEASRALQDAMFQANQARWDLFNAIHEGDAITLARAQLFQAAETYRAAQGDAAQLSALAQQVRAQRAIEDAITDAFAAHQDLLAAIFEAVGNSVDAAKAGLASARARFDEARRRADTDGTVTESEQANLDRLLADVITRGSAVRDAELATQERNIDFALQMGRITATQAITQLEGFLSIVAGNEEATQRILLKIKSLRDSLGQDLLFNFGEIRLPTPYEVRRLNQAAQAGRAQAATQITDARQVSIEINAYNAGDYEDAIRRSVDALSAAPRTGTVERLY